MPADAEKASKNITSKLALDLRFPSISPGQKLGKFSALHTSFQERIPYVAALSALSDERPDLTTAPPSSLWPKPSSTQPRFGRYFGDSRAALGFRRLAIIDLAGANQPLYSEIARSCSSSTARSTTTRNYAGSVAAGHAFSTGRAVKGAPRVRAVGRGGARSSARHVRLRSVSHRHGRAFSARATPSASSPSTMPWKASASCSAPEIKGLITHPRAHRSLNERRLAHWLCMEYLPDEETLFEGVRKLPAGHWLRWRDGRAECGRWLARASLPRCEPQSGGERRGHRGYRGSRWRPTPSPT